MSEELPYLFNLWILKYFSFERSTILYTMTPLKLNFRIKILKAFQLRTKKNFNKDEKEIRS